MAEAGHAGYNGRDGGFAEGIRYADDRKGCWH
jgi:hypothetical protein